MGKSKGTKPFLHQKNKDYSFGFGVILWAQRTQTLLLSNHSITTEKLRHEATEVCAHSNKSQGHIKDISFIIKTEAKDPKPTKQKQNNKKGGKINRRFSYNHLDSDAGAQCKY